MHKKSKYRGITIGNAIEVFLLMQMTVLAGDTVLELQRKINVLEIFCEKWGMEVNLKKTKVVVFRKGGKTSKSERFFYRNRSVEIDILSISGPYFLLKKCMVQSIINLSLTGRESSQYCEENDMEGGTSETACIF